MDLQRRYLIKATVTAVAGAAVLDALGAPWLDAATARPLAAETTHGGVAALDLAERRVLAAALGHMRPDTTGDDMAAEALVAYTDAGHVAKTGRVATAGRAAYVEGLAACVLGSIRGHAGDWESARVLFTEAKSAGRRATELHDMRGPSVTVLAAALMGKVVLYNQPGHAATAVAFGRQATTAARHPTVGRIPAGAALAPSVLARAHALAGNHVLAREALDDTERYLSLPDYVPTPYSEGGDGPDRVYDGPLSLLGYNRRAHDYVRAEVFGMLGDLTRCREATADYLEGGDASHTSAAVLALVEARCVAAALTPAAGAELAVHVLENLPEGATRGTVAGRALDVLAYIKSGVAAGGHTSPAVDELAELTHALTPTADA